MTDVRVKEAARTLVETDLSLREVAETWGFADQSHFGKVFRRVLQMSPASYRARDPAREDVAIDRPCEGLGGGSVRPKLRR